MEAKIRKSVSEKMRLGKLLVDIVDAPNQTEARGFPDRLDDVLKTLSYREREIVKLHYGIGDGYIHTVREIASIFKMSPYKTDSVLAKAISKLRHPIRLTRLMGLPRPATPPALPRPASKEDFLKIAIDFSELGARARKVLTRLAIGTYGELAKRTEDEIRASHKGVGFVTVNELKALLARYGLTFANPFSKPGL